MSSIEESMVAWLSTLTTPPIRAFYQHLGTAPPAEFVWCRRAGDEGLDTIDGSGEPDIIYWDVEVYASTLERQTELCRLLRAKRDYRGAFGTGFVDDVQVQDQQDDYEPQASGQTLPPWSAAFRLITTLYEES